MTCVQDNFEGGKSLNIFGIMMTCGQDIFAGEKVFESFHDNDGLRR